MKEKPKEPDLIEKIAYGLPLEVRAEFLNEMRYLRSLPESDELLRIIRVMQFLTLLTEQVPKRVLTEREKLETACREIINTANKLEKTGSEYYQQLNKRLIQLPVDIATGISPKAIVERINDDLKKQFDLSTIPIVAGELHSNAVTIRTAAKEYTQASKELCGSWKIVAAEANESIEKIRNTVLGAAKTSEQAAINFSNTFRKTYYLALRILIGISLIAGIMIGILIFDYFRPYKKTIFEITPDLDWLIEERRMERLEKHGEFYPMPYQKVEPPILRELTPAPKKR